MREAEPTFLHEGDSKDIPKAASKKAAKTKPTGKKRAGKDVAMGPIDEDSKFVTNSASMFVVRNRKICRKIHRGRQDTGVYMKM